MGQQFEQLSDKHIEFIAQQKVYFVATAVADGKINLSPKGQDSFRVLSPTQVAWLNVTGSGNETAAHVQINPRMTIMFSAFEGNPLILRLYGSAQVIHHQDPEWNDLYPLFSPLPGARQIFKMSIELVQSSCGMAVPYFDFVGQRDLLNDWALKKGDDGVAEYWEKKNQLSLDGLQTNILEKNLSE